MYSQWNKLENGLQTAITPVHAYQIWWSMVPKWRKWDRFSTHSTSTFWHAHISGWALLPKNFTVCKGWPTLANAYLIGMGLPQQFLRPKIRQLAKTSSVLWFKPSTSVEGIAPNFFTWCDLIEAYSTILFKNNYSTKIGNYYYRRKTGLFATVNRI